MFHYILVSDSSNVGIDGVHVSKQHVGSFRVCGYVSLHEGCVASIIPSPLLLLSLPAVHALYTASDDSCVMKTRNEDRGQCLHQFNSITSISATCICRRDTRR